MALRILYAGPLKPFTTTDARCFALTSLGHNVRQINQWQFLEAGPRLTQKLQLHLLYGPGPRAYNQALVANARESRPDLVWIDQGGLITPQTVRTLARLGAPVLHYTSDLLEHRRYWFRHYFRAISHYDVHVITNSLNRPLLERRSARQIVMSEFGFDPRVHRPTTLTPAERRSYEADAVFVGHWEPASERLVAALRGSGVHVKVWGPGWNRSGLEDASWITAAYGEEYVKVVAAAKICLCFLSKKNRNQSAGRTFEIPAIGGFLLAERTTDHLAYYTEGQEAEFFGSAEELVAKATHYLKHESAREMIANAGRLRCLQSGWRHQDRCRAILDQCGFRFADRLNSA
jgi:spore maturation protein CgeB